VPRRESRDRGPRNICNHTFRGADITAYLENPEAKLEHARRMAAYADTKTTRLYDRRRSGLNG
jgi:hypothetical protein